jgi:hypothetical protein
VVASLVFVHDDEARCVALPSLIGSRIRNVAPDGDCEGASWLGWAAGKLLGPLSGAPRRSSATVAQNVVVWDGIVLL